MASYHLRLKRDRKPDGSRVDAIAHAEYVNREGKYQDYDARKDIMEHLSGNFIFTDRKKAGFGGNEFIPLYHTDSYGSIAATENGIELTRKPSIDTMSIALMIADRTMQHAPLRLAGSKKFQEQAVNAAVINELNISFADERLQKILVERRMIAYEERRRFIESGGRYTKRRGLRPYDGNAGIEGGYTGSQETFPGVPGIPSLYPNTESLLVNIEVKQGAIPVLAEGGFSMPTLPERHVADVGEESPVLLPGDAMLHLDEICKRVYQSVRWDVASVRRGLAERTANHIVDEIMSRKGELAAQRHLEYINRDAAYEKKGGCLMTGAQLPNWAKGSAKTFFAAADKFEDPGNRRYLELELSLPNELSLQENKKILDEFLANHLSNHYYDVGVKSPYS